MIALIASGCASMEPPPRVDVRSDTVEAAAFTGLDDVSDAVDAVWWTTFDDAVLTQLIETALSENRSLEAARFNLEAANALLARAELGGSYSTSSSASLTFENRNAAFELNRNLAGATGASWEWDLFDRIDAQIRTQSFNRDAVLQARRDIAVGVAAETAQAYVDLRGAQQRLKVAQRSAELQAESLGLLRELVDAGRSNDLDLRRAEALYRTTLASLPTFDAQKEVARARLRALGATEAGLDAPGDIPTPDGRIATGSAESLIRRRPDIRAAEARVAQSLAFGDVERSRLFPRITLNAGLDSFFGTFGNGASIENVNLGFGPAISWEGPDLRGVRADIAVSDAQTRAALATYEQTVLNALADVEIGLSAYQREIERRDDLIEAERAAADALRLAQLRFEEGLDDFLDVLDAQRTLLSSRDDRVQNDIFIATTAIAAYRALGGMWTDAELQRSSQTPSESLAP